MPGWVILAAWITAYDLYAIRSGRQTLSAAFYEAVKHPQRRWLVVASWAYLTAHLFHLGNPELDPSRYLVAKLTKGRYGQETNR